jgi:hypothetical protein
LSPGIVFAAGLEIPITDAVWTFEGSQTTEYLGYSVNYAGDLNGDNYEDFAVGAPGYDEPGFVDTGRAWVFYGSATGPSATPDVTLTPPHSRTSGSFGNVVFWAGDVNDDTYDDLLVSMLNYNGDPQVNQQGAVFVYYGSDTGIGTTPDWTGLGGQAQLQFGYGAAPASDVNGDDFDDIIVGSNVGAYVYYGSANGLDPDGSRPIGLPGNADWTADTDQVDSYFGMHVGMAGDLNGDNYSDVWVAAPWYDNGEQDEGVVFVWYGSDTGLGPAATPWDADWYVQSNDVSSYTGGEWLVPSASSLGDVNGDNYEDFIVAAAKYDAVSDREGLAMLFYGSANGLDPDGSRPNGNPANADWVLAGANPVDILGYSVGRAGDYNNDGFNDVLIGVFAHDATGDNGEGMVQLWLGSASGLTPGSLPRHVDCFSAGSQQGEHVGTTVSGAGDVNNDGYDDFLTGAVYWDTPTENEAGRTYLFLGEPMVFAEDYESGDLWRYSSIVP